ncbi:MAG: hypothetical protein K2X07_00030 [Caulobacteraceae bacterium]|nr:hypothetical protein [Caulobacteraceae bacterium]
MESRDGLVFYKLQSWVDIGTASLTTHGVLKRANDFLCFPGEDLSHAQIRTASGTVDADLSPYRDVVERSAIVSTCFFLIDNGDGFLFVSKKIGKESPPEVATSLGLWVSPGSDIWHLKPLAPLSGGAK